ncbi:MAG: chemotaxis protein CheE [Brevundimonas sp.]|uniref:chemotaxis protein CheE n=1 Tax=Brevundimonas sp. TaxID=1871086 RepID=UPI0025B88BE4|nr:chemotaxis protein CheE [Brevundimonas sp.]MBX3476034.1 chemotaxis protein CheE [Brevundimonas sp.]
MTVVRTIARKSRLSTMIDQAGGISVGVAKRQAQANLEGMKDRGLAIIAERIDSLNALPAPQTAEDALPARIEAYRLSSEVIDASGMFDMQDLCAAAKGLCDLLDAAGEDGDMDWRIVTVHAQSMRLLMSLPAEATAQRKAVTEHLNQVLVHKLGV